MDADARRDARTGQDAELSPEASFDASAGPVLTSLSVSPLTLTPAFSPSTHDYYVRCATGANALTVSMTASPGAVVGITAPSSAASSGKAEVMLSLDANAALVATASGGGGGDAGVSSAYWVRCLPPDFPTLTMTTREDVPAPAPGYYLVGNGVPAALENGYAIVLDGNGVPVWYEATSTQAGAMGVDSLMPNQISFVPYLLNQFGPASGSYVVQALSPFTSTLVTGVQAPLDMHDFRELPNGDYLLLSWPIVVGVDLTGLGAFGKGWDIIDCKIQEVSPTGESVWTWDAMDHFDPAQDCTVPLTMPVLATPGTDAGAVDAALADGGENVTVVDPFHCNSIDVATNGDLLVSARNMDSVFMVSKATGAIEWKMGGVAYNKDSAPLLTVTGDALNGFYRQHDARLQGSGMLSVFDDKTSMSATARGLLVSYDVAAGTASVVWQYSGAAASISMGSMRIFSDGTRLIGWGQSFSMNPVFTEVTETGVAIRDFNFPSGSASYRAIKVPPSELDLDLMRQTAGQ